MSKLNIIKRKKTSTQKTAQITRALELVSSSKLSRLADKNAQSEYYASILSKMIGNLANCTESFAENNSFIKPHKSVNVVGLVIISSDRGLCGNLNHLLFREVVQYMQDLQAQEKGVVLCTVGQKATEFFQKYNLPVLEAYPKPELSPDATLSACQKMIYQYTQNNIDEVHLFYNKMVSILEQKPNKKQLLPIEKTPEADSKHQREYIFEPNREVVFKSLLDRYIRYTIYQAAIENATSEEAARMIAMKNATDNANKIFDSLQLSANKARQAQITTELSEIIGGSEAIT